MIATIRKKYCQPSFWQPFRRFSNPHPTVHDRSRKQPLNPSSWLASQSQKLVPLISIHFLGYYCQSNASNPREKSELLQSNIVTTCTNRTGACRSLKTDS